MKALFYPACLLAVSTFFGSCDLFREPTTEEQIAHTYKDWEEGVLAENQYSTEATCGSDEEDAPKYYLTGKYESKIGDLNADGIDDAVVLFSPVPCSDSTKELEFQMSFLMLSAPDDNYRTITLVKPLENTSNILSYFYQDITEAGKLSATFISYGENNDACCPVDMKEIEVDYTDEGKFMYGEMLLSE